MALITCRFKHQKLLIKRVGDGVLAGSGGCLVFGPSTLRFTAQAAPWRSPPGRYFSCNLAMDILKGDEIGQGRIQSE